jgi:hypothetical protein
MTLLVTDLKLVEGNNILTLAQGNLMKIFVRINTIFLSKSLDILNWIGSW